MSKKPRQMFTEGTQSVMVICAQHVTRNNVSHTDHQAPSCRALSELWLRGEIRDSQQNRFRFRTIDRNLTDESIANDSHGINDKCTGDRNWPAIWISAMKDTILSNRLPVDVSQEWEWGPKLGLELCATRLVFVDDRQNLDILFLKRWVTLTQLCQLISAGRSPIPTEEDQNKELAA